MDYRLKELRGLKRRNFLRWIGAVGAAVGLERTGLLNFLADSGGSALADGLCPASNRSRPASRISRRTSRGSS